MKVLFQIRQFIKYFLNIIDPMWEAIYQVFIGIKLIQKMREKSGKDTHIFLMRGATGDTYIQLMIVNNWIRENGIESYILLGDPAGIEGLKKLFENVGFVKITSYRAECIEKAYMLLGEECLNLTLMFPWTYSLYFNRCRVRMIEGYNFMDTYRWYVLGLSEKIRFKKPVFRKLDDKMKRELEEKGIIKDKTVVIAPEANSVTRLSEKFWNGVIKELEKRGFKVFVNCISKNNYAAENIFFSYWESVPLIEFAGCFIAIRSGLCDIVSSAKAKKIILYPQKDVNTDYGEHRSEIDFCGLREMGLVKMESDLTELSTPLIKNITQAKDCMHNQTDCENESSMLKEKILLHFKQKG